MNPCAPWLFLVAILYGDVDPREKHWLCYATESVDQYKKDRVGITYAELDAAMERGNGKDNPDPRHLDCYRISMWWAEGSGRQEYRDCMRERAGWP
jgi:hypothetical protein